MNEESLSKSARCREVNNLILSEKYEEARALTLLLLEDEPDDHWLLVELAETYYEQKNYEKSIEYTEQALKISPHCPLVLWQHAGTLDMLKRSEDAVIIYKRLLRRGIQKIAYGECHEGIRWARSLVNDCRYRLGLVYADLGEFQNAIKYLNSHINHRNRNCYSIYDLRMVKKKLALILKGKNPRQSKMQTENPLFAG